MAGITWHVNAYETTTTENWWENGMYRGASVSVSVSVTLRTHATVMLDVFEIII